MVCMIFCRTIVKRHNGSEPTESEDATKRALILFSIQYVMILLLFLLNLFADAKPKHLDPRVASLKNPCPKLFASFASKLTFAWVSPLMWKGFRQPLEPSMLWKMDPQLTSREINPMFDDVFLPDFDRSRNKKAQMIRDGQPVFKMSGKDDKVKTPVAGTYKSIFPSLIRTFGSSFFFGSALKEHRLYFSAQQIWYRNIIQTGIDGLYVLL